MCFAEREPVAMATGPCVQAWSFPTSSRPAKEPMGAVPSPICYSHQMDLRSPNADAATEQVVLMTVTVNLVFLSIVISLSL